MHELRKDPLLGRWVAVLNDSKPPEAYDATTEKRNETSCVLCAGNETKTPKEIASVREDGKWWARVIPNFEPVFQIEGELGRKGLGMYDKMNGIGANELIVETPEHTKQPEDIGVEQVMRVLRLYRERIADLERDPRLRYTLIYKDSGRSAGASFTHPHSEIAATPVIPKQVKEELDGAKQYFVYKERCIFCDMMREELRFGDRIISETRDFLVFSPFAPRFPFEFWVLPKKHSCAFQDISDAETEDLGLTLSRMLKNMRSILKDPPYSYVLHTAPNRVPRRNHWHTLGEDFHWHIEIMPRLLRTSGFEWGSGFHILTTSPEDAAKYLREA
ncbi:MAG TPA: galactose-1-phosphate uridylyltransferase [Thermodesulfovibrionales bacterium]|nr:galactose-1-phosphate uridylyltransferase [Thermodesulfovibrionales bacterium]